MFVGFRFLFYGEPVRVEKRCSPDDEIDMVANQLILDDFLLGLDHVIAAHGEIFEGDVLFEPVASPVELALPEARQEKDSLTPGFARNRPGVYADTAGNFLAFHNAHSLANLCGLNGRLLARGA